MKTMTRCVGVVLLVCLLIGILPVIGTASTAQADAEKPATRAAAITSISVPAYSGGTASTWMTYDGGDNISYHDGENRSKMQIVKGTTATQFNNYCTKLTSNGYSKVWSRTLAAQSGSNRYAKFLSPDGTYSVYTYFVPFSSQTRIIVDTHKDTVEGFYYDGKGNGTTEVYLYGLTYPDNGYAYTSTELGIQRRFPNGSMQIVKMPDNSLFVIDGGNKLQMSERAMEDLYAFCREITGLPEGQKIVVSGWHISHIHNDHSVGFSRFLTKYSHAFDLKNIIYNTDLVEAGDTNEQALNQVGKLYPNARYYKPHTGERFTIAGVTFDVLYTIDDWYKPNSSNKLIVRDSACLNYSNDNNTSMALRMTFDGKTALWLGDLEKADADLMAMYPAADLKSDILQLPHHLLDDHTTLVKTVEPTVAFANLSKQSAYTRGKVFNYIIKIDSLTDIYFAGNETVGYRGDKGIFYRKPHVTFEYGNWGLTTYDVRNANPVTSQEMKASEQFYRYSRAKELQAGPNAYAIVDHTTDWIMAYDTAAGSASRAMPAHYIDDAYYLGASQRGLVNWQIQYSDHTTKSDAIVPNYGNYSVTIHRGTGGYWGTSTQNTGMYFGYNDTFQSVGMYGSWTGVHNQMESTSKGTWMDQMNGGTFLIYRHSNGTYYPLYRDGDVLEDNGWGVAKLTYSQARNKCHYLKTRLYLYEETPSDMYVSWTGHSDYYVYPGLPQNEIISHVVSDLRVKYRLPAFGVNGEIDYDASLTKEPGTFRLEFTKTLSPNTVGDYPAVIKYINPNGTMQELGRITVHVEKRDLVEDGGAELFFGFSDTPSDKLRYRLEPQYNYFNFDSDKRWTAALYDNDNKKYTASSFEVDPHEGTFAFVIEDKTSTRKTVTLDLFAGNQFPLKYDPQYAEVVQIRLKLENIKSHGTYNPFFRLWYYGADQVRHFDVAHYFGANYISDGEYITLTLDLFDQAEVDANASVSGAPTGRFCDMDEISSIRLGFYYLMVNDTSKNGKITIDHVYIGPKDSLPVQEQSILFDFGNTPKDQERYKAESYKGYNFDLPQKPAWVARETSTATDAMTNFTIDNGLGVAKIPVAEDIAYGVSNSWYGPWFLTAAINGTHPNTTMPSTMALAYDGEKAEYVQMRFKAEGCDTVPGRKPEAMVIFDRSLDGSVGRGAYDMMTEYELKNGEWITLTIPVSAEFKAADFINTFGVRFRSIKAQSKGTGQVILDYLYAGTREELPTQIAIVQFTAEDGTLLQKLFHPIGTEAVYSGTLPTKEADENGEWTFVGWMDENGNLVDLKNLTKDVILKPYFCQTPILDEKIRIGHSLNLASDISINFAVEKAVLEGFDMDTVYLLLERDVYEGNVKTGTQSVKILPVEQGNLYYFTLQGLTAVHMNDRVRAVLYGTNNGQIYYSNTDDYSIADYAYSQMNKANSTAKLKKLCAELLRYGSAAQTFKSYRTDAPVDSKMTEEQRSWLTDLDTVTFEPTNRGLKDMEDPAVVWIGKSLDLNSKITLKFVVDVDPALGSAEELSMKLTYGDIHGVQREIRVTDVAPYGKEENWYAFSFDGFLAAELRTVVSARVYYGDRPVSETIHYSAETYGNNKTGTLGDLCKALFAYSDRAKDFFAK